MVYGLGRRGARVVSENGNALSAGSDWTERNKRAGAKFIEHTLAIAGFMVALEIACREREGIALLREADIIAVAPEHARTAREPLRLTIRDRNGKIGISSVLADGLFGLAFSDNTAAYFLLEIDRGSMPVARTRVDKTSFKRKLHVYWEAWKAGRHVEHFGLKQVRVLTVTDSDARVNNMLNAVNEITGGKGSNFFLFATVEQLAAISPLDATWTTGRRGSVHLTE